MVFACLLLPQTGLVGDISLIRSFLDLLVDPEHSPGSAAGRVRSWFDPRNKHWAAVLARAVPDIALAALIGLITYTLVAVTTRWMPPGTTTIPSSLGWFLDKINRFLVWIKLRPFHPEPGHLKSLIEYGLPILLCYACVTRPFRFGLAVGALLLGAAYG